MTARGKTGHRRPAANDTGATAEEHYHREKARRVRKPAPDSDLLAAAKREYLALLEQEAAKGKGGRPKKNATKPRDATEPADTDDGDKDTPVDDE